MLKRELYYSGTFQSTHSVRSATGTQGLSGAPTLHFNPRTPCGVRHNGIRLTFGPVIFQSTHSVRSATCFFCFRLLLLQISIHALRAECDVILHIILLSIAQFQSTHSVRSATRRYGNRRQARQISIHALRAECDERDVSGHRHTQNFNPRTPCGVRRMSAHFIRLTSRFQSTHSVRSATRPLPPLCEYAAFQSTHSVRSATLGVK